MKFIWLSDRPSSELSFASVSSKTYPDENGFACTIIFMQIKLIYIYVKSFARGLVLKQGRMAYTCTVGRGGEQAGEYLFLNSFRFTSY